MIGFGLFYLFLGIILFFDRGLLALSNIFFLAGVALLLGWKSTVQLARRNYKGSLAFAVGIFLILVRWPVFGAVFEAYGSVILFSGFWNSIKAFLFQVPVVGWLLQYPFLFLDRSKRS